MKTKTLKDNRYSAFMMLLLILLLIYTVVLFYPMIWGFFNSLKSQQQFRTNPLGMFDSWPWEWKWSNYKDAFAEFSVKIKTDNGFRDVYMMEQFGYSFLYAGIGAFMATITPCVMAYLTSKYKYVLNKVINGIVIVTMVLPIIGNLPSEIQVIKVMGLYDSLLGMFIIKMSFLGIYYLVFSGIFQSIPVAYNEAASIDGASHMRIFLCIILPLVKNIFFTVMLIKFIEFWNDYQTPLIYLKSYPTVAYGMYYYNHSSDNATSTVPMKLAGCFVMLLPILIIFIAFNRMLLGNLTMGGIKE